MPAMRAYVFVLLGLSLLTLLLHLILQAHYRLASCFSARKKYSEAMGAFSRSLQLLLNDSSSTEHDKVDTLTQLLSAALKHPGTIIVYTWLKNRCRVKNLSHEPYD